MTNNKTSEVSVMELEQGFRGEVTRPDRSCFLVGSW